MNSQDHLTNEERLAWWQRTLPPEALLEVSDHLQICETCRAELQAAAPAGGAAHGPAPSYEELVPWIEGGLDPLTRRELAQRRDQLAAISAELADLRRFEEEMNALPSHDYSTAESGVPRASWILPIAAGLAIGLGFVWWNSTQSNHGAITLRDSGKSIVVRQDGSIPAFGPLPPGLQRAVQEASSGKIVLPPEVGGLRGSTGTLAGAPGSATGFTVVAPVGTLVESLRPVLRWTRAENVTGYRVNLARKNGEGIISSPVLPAGKTEWTPDEALTPGDTYLWEVEAFGQGEMIAKAPAPPEPEARFAVLPNDKRGELDRLRAKLGQSHLLLGLAYARAGLIDKARQEFEALARENPGNDLPARLIAGLTTQRPTKTNGAQ
jgi:hypothetical protein